MLRGLFVTGSDTGVGKTVVSAALMHRLRPQFEQVRYWKPIQTGILQDDDTAMVRVLASCNDSEIYDAGIRLTAPLAPHFAARLQGKTVSLNDVMDFASKLDIAVDEDDRPEQPVYVVEGAGGLLVPINKKEMMVDLIARLELPVVIATRSSLGTINHTLLSIEALRKQDLKIAGVIMVGDPSPDNREAIEQFGDVPVLGNMPFFENLNARSIAEWSAVNFDKEGRLWKVIL